MSTGRHCNLVINSYGGCDPIPSSSLYHVVPCFQQVNKIEINYSKTAKKMDMKRLKSSMWSLLTESPDKPREVSRAQQEVQEEEEESGYQGSLSCLQQEALPDDQVEVCGDKVFSETTKTLLHRYRTPTGGGGRRQVVNLGVFLTLCCASFQSAQHHGPEPVGTAGLCGSAAPRQRKGQFDPSK